jgi:hypothetical protein
MAAKVRPRVILPSESALPCLPRARHHDGGHDPQAFGETVRATRRGRLLASMAWMMIIHDVNDQARSAFACAASVAPRAAI